MMTYLYPFYDYFISQSGLNLELVEYSWLVGIHQFTSAIFWFISIRWISAYPTNQLMLVFQILQFILQCAFTLGIYLEILVIKTFFVNRIIFSGREN